MRYVIDGVQQERLIEYDLDNTDAIILSWFNIFIRSGKMDSYINPGNERCYWVFYQTVLDELPVLKISNRRTIARRFDKYEKRGLLKQQPGPSYKYGVYSYFSLMQPAFNELFKRPKDIDSVDGADGIDQDSRLGAVPPTIVESAVEEKIYDHKPVQVNKARRTKKNNGMKEYYDY